MDASALDKAISALEKAISALEASSESLDWWLKVWTAFVAIGVSVEIFEVITEYFIERRAWRRATIRSPEKPSIWFFAVKFIGPILVTAGVVGELWISAVSGQINTELRIKNRSLVGLINQKSSEANERAGNISDRADRLAEILETERKRAARFQEESDAARLILNKQLRSQGPRYVLLREAAPALVRELAPFAGQRAALLVCGMYRTDRETVNTWGALASILGPDIVDGIKGADWKMVRGDPFWDKCALSMQGITVFISSLARKNTREAAETLSKGLLRTLPRYNKMPATVDPQSMFMEAARRSMDKDDPEILAADDPNLVVIFIGEHPPQ